MHPLIHIRPSPLICSSENKIARAIRFSKCFSNSCNQSCWSMVLTPFVCGNQKSLDLWFNPFLLPRDASSLQYQNNKAILLFGVYLAQVQHFHSRTYCQGCFNVVESHQRPQSQPPFVRTLWGHQDLAVSHLLPIRYLGSHHLSGHQIPFWQVLVCSTLHEKNYVIT